MLAMYFLSTQYVLLLDYKTHGLCSGLYIPLFSFLGGDPLRPVSHIFLLLVHSQFDEAPVAF